MAVVNIDENVIGDHTLVSGVANQTIRVYRIVLVAALAQTVSFKDGTTVVFGPFSLTGGNEFFCPYDGIAPWIETTAGNDLKLHLGGGVQISGQIFYYQS